MTEIDDWAKVMILKSNGTRGNVGCWCHDRSENSSWKTLEDARKAPARKDDMMAHPSRKIMETSVILRQKNCWV